MNAILYPVIGALEWWMAMRRTLACARGEVYIMSGLVFAESFLGLWVLNDMIHADSLMAVLVYSLGSAAGAASAHLFQRKRHE